MFNGRNLDGWVVKLAHHEVGDNYADTFRVENGAIRVMYDKYGDFGARFGHLFYKQKLSHYVLALEYRFFGEQAKGGPGYARLNSGVMVHSPGAGDDPEGPGLADFGRGAVPGRQPDDDERLHAGHGDLHEGRDGEGALHQLHVAPLRRRRVGRGRSRGARLRARAPPDRRQDRARVREADDRRRRRHRLRPGDQEGRHAARRRLHRPAGREPAGRVPQHPAAESVRLHEPASPAYRPYFVHRDDSRCTTR